MHTGSNGPTRAPPHQRSHKPLHHNRGPVTGGVTAVIPDAADQIAHRARRGCAGGRPPAFDPVRYRDRNVVERSYALMQQWRGLATRYDCAPPTTGPQPSYTPSSPGAAALRDTP